RIGGVVACVGFWIYVVVRGTPDEPVSDCSRRRAFGDGLRGLVSRSLPSTTGRTCTGRARGFARNDSPPHRRTGSGCGRTGTRLASCPHVSGIGRREGRISRRRRDGGIGLWLRAAKNRKHLVSHQSSCGWGLCAIAETRSGTTEFVSRGCLLDCAWSAWPRVHTRGGALWRHASNVRAPADHTRRTDRAGIVVGPAVFDVRSSESLAGEPHRLGLVHSFAG